MKNDSHCRCGHKGYGEHPCHSDEYNCRKPATQRFITYPICLAGFQQKLGAYETWACDSCWEEYKNRIDSLDDRRNS